MKPNQTSRSIAAALALAVFIVGVPTVLVAIDAVPWSDSISNVGPLLTGPDDGTLAMTVVTLIGWIAWAVVAVSIALDVAALLRGPSFQPGGVLSVPRRFTAPLVASAALLFVAAPTVALPLTAPPAHAGVIVDDIDPPVEDAIPSAHEAAVTEAPATVEYTVRRGDSLWRIAERHLGDGRRYVEIFELNRAVIGDDPDFILPSTVLQLPTVEASAEPATPVPAEIAPAPVERVVPDRIDPAPEPQHAPQAAEATTAGDESTTGSETWIVSGLTGASAVLGGALLLTYRARRLTLLRHRRPGHVLTPPPPALRDTEKTLAAVAAPTAAHLHALDALLRTLTDEDHGAPRLVSLCLSGSAVELRLEADCELRSPWQQTSEMVWTASLDDVEANDTAPPYPLLVSVGADDAGGLWFVDLDACGRIAITGDQSRAHGLARHLCAELALSPWSSLVRIDAIGIGDELNSLDPIRLRTGAAVEDVVSLIKDWEQAASNQGAVDDLQVVVADVQDTELPIAVWESWGRALVTVSPSAPTTGVVVNVDPEGVLTCSRLPVDLVAARLSTDDAALTAAIAQAVGDGDTLWVENTEATLDVDLAEPRNDDPAGPRSALPASSERYENCAATTRADVQQIAPLATPTARKVVEESDPTLDADVAEWFAAETIRPRLTLLGPVSAQANGEYQQIATRKAYFVEMLAYIALHPEGVPAAAIAEAFSVSASRARTDVGFVRSWLGNNADGHPHLPAANQSRGFTETGVPVYQLDNVLVDVDLFRRLCTRGRARGEDGNTDLRTALRLVQGEPFTGLRDRGWSWLLDGERLHETVTMSIVDTAHILVTDALERGDLDQARMAAETAQRAAPYDEIGRLDLIAVTRASGHDDLADSILDQDIINRRDDDLPPIDLPSRTRKILARQASHQTAE